MSTAATTSTDGPLDGLTIAVPRGALFGGTVELLASLGLDTEELRSNDRKLLFEDIGVITMRPSDVPTYVEDGAADLGITGKDVLLERAGRASDHGARERGRRQIYELLDLGYGRCTMVLRHGRSRQRSRREPGRRGACAGWGRCGSRPSIHASPRATWRRPAGRRRSSRSRARSSSPR